ncbi:MAG: SMC family ATPase [Actinomycetota bacterium]|nr:SMC family ATPase [Actinomycetota bacterium]
MRPLRLRLEGFTAFREPAEIDFEEVDLFALTGGTGSGKTSILDGIGFALYGSVPRYDNQNLVSPVITQGKVEARVSLDFTVQGDRYTAARVVRRTGKGGATTKEARLEREGEVVAGDAVGVTEAVERLLGLPFDHFTRCVVLPQGDFARFLHDRPAERQDLLGRLLDLGVYQRMMQAANRRAVALDGECRLIEDQLSHLADSTPEARREAEGRVTTLERLLDRLEEAQPALDELAEAVRAAEEGAAEHEEQAKLLRALAVPPGIEDLAVAIVDAAGMVGRAEQAASRTAAAVSEADSALSRLPQPGPLQAAGEAHRQRRLEAAQLEETRLELRRMEAAEGEAGELLEEAERSLQQRVEELRRRHAAHHLAASLVTGEPCPVCLQPVEEIANQEAPPGFQEAQQAHADAEQARTAAQQHHRAVREERLRAEARVGDLCRRLEDLASRLSEHPDLQALEATLEVIARAEQALAEGRRADQQAHHAVAEARRRRDALLEREVSARRDFQAARDRVAVLGPPLAQGTHLSHDWNRLVQWGGREAARRDQKASQARAEAEAGDESRRKLLDELDAACREQGVGPVGGSLRDACLAEVLAAKAELARLEGAIHQADRLRQQRQSRREQERVARELARHLSANGFEKWILDEALGVLVEAANLILAHLSNGHYSLAIDDRANFQVVDHRNADERRSAKTLSGGETFLASLALALALADQLSAMSVHGGGRLESIFLDEGFGTLDAETLETVAAVIHELGASGRTVGLVTHVRELAEQVPVRFVVSKGPRTASVEKVVA